MAIQNFIPSTDGEGSIGLPTQSWGSGVFNTGVFNNSASVGGNMHVGGNLTVVGKTITEEVETVTTSNGVIFEGSTADDHELTLKAVTLTADRSITLPDADGTVALTSDIPAQTPETNDLSSSVTWVNVPDANITEGSVTQHQAALSITESQISDLGSYLTDYTVTQNDVTQHQAALSITESQISDLGSYLTSVSWNDIGSKPSTFTPSAHTLSSHSDVSATAPTNGQVLKWNGSAWAPGTDSAGTSIGNLSDISDVSATSPTNGQVLKWNGSAWAPGADEVGLTSVSWNDIGSKPSTFTPSAHTLSSHSDVSATAPTNGQVLKWNGSAWAPGADDAGTTISSLNDVGGVTISSAADGDALVYDGSNWVNSQPTEVAFFDSDESLKDGISEISDATNKLKSIKGVNFVWNSTASEALVGKKDVGVIAQDIQKAIPEAVKSNDDGILSVQYHKIIPLLIETIKEQEKRISELEKRI